MPKYKNTTKLPQGIELDGVLTFSPEEVSNNAFKIHLIQWSDEKNRPIALDNITIKQYDEKWQNPIDDKLVITPVIQSSNTDGVLKLDDGNIGFSIQYKPFVAGEEYKAWFIVTIKIVGEDSFDIAFSSFIKGGGTSTGHGDVNITPK